MALSCGPFLSQLNIQLLFSPEFNKNILFYDLFVVCDTALRPRRIFSGYEFSHTGPVPGPTLLNTYRVA